jgi:hypothetical protein
MSCNVPVNVRVSGSTSCPCSCACAPASHPSVTVPFNSVFPVLVWTAAAPRRAGRRATPRGRSRRSLGRDEVEAGDAQPCELRDLIRTDSQLASRGLQQHHIIATLRSSRDWEPSVARSLAAVCRHVRTPSPRRLISATCFSVSTPSAVAVSAASRRTSIAWSRSVPASTRPTSIRVPVAAGTPRRRLCSQMRSTRPPSCARTSDSSSRPPTNASQSAASWWYSMRPCVPALRASSRYATSARARPHGSPARPRARRGRCSARAYPRRRGRPRRRSRQEAPNLPRREVFDAARASLRASS